MWPQITMVVFATMTITIAIIKNGKPKGNYNIIEAGLSVLIELVVLYYGGFFNPLN